MDALRILITTKHGSTPATTAAAAKQGCLTIKSAAGVVEHYQEGHRLKLEATDTQSWSSCGSARELPSAVLASQGNAKESTGKEFSSARAHCSNLELGSEVAAPHGIPRAAMEGKSEAHRLTKTDSGSLVEQEQSLPSAGQGTQRQSIASFQHVDTAAVSRADADSVSRDKVQTRCTGQPGISLEDDSTLQATSPGVREASVAGQGASTGSRASFAGTKSPFGDREQNARRSRASVTWRSFRRSSQAEGGSRRDSQVESAAQFKKRRWSLLLVRSICIHLVYLGGH